MTQKFFTALQEVEMVFTTEYIVGAESAAHAKLLVEMGAGCDPSIVVSADPIAKVSEFTNSDKPTRVFVTARADAAQYRKAIEQSPAAAACILH